MTRAALVCLALAGCGPALGPLVAGRHYREAVCGAVDRGGSDRAMVGAALDADAEVRAQLRVVPGALAADRVALVRVIAQTNVLPLDDLTLTASLVTDDGRLAAVAAGWESLSWATQERLPPWRTSQTWLTLGNLFRGGAAIFSAGLSLLFSNFQPETVLVDAPRSEFLRLAPRTTALMDVVEQSGCARHTLTDGAGVRCVWYFVLDEAGRAPVSLRVSARYVSRRLVSQTSTDRECEVTRAYGVPLGAPGDVEARAAARFGDAMQPLPPAP